MDRKKFENYMLLNDKYMKMATKNPFYREKSSQEVNNTSISINSESNLVNGDANKECNVKNNKEDNKVISLKIK